MEGKWAEPVIPATVCTLAFEADSKWLLARADRSASLLDRVTSFVDDISEFEPVARKATAQIPRRAAHHRRRQRALHTTVAVSASP